MNVSLDNLSTELLVKIFQYLSVCDLCKLRQTCIRFNYIIKASLHLILKNDSLVTNQIDSTIRKRSTCILNLNEKFRISHNWKIGKYRENSFLKTCQLFMPWINLSKELIWLSRGKYIFAYKRIGRKLEKPYYTICSKNNEDVCKFVYKQNYVVAGEREGGLWLWSEIEQKILLDVPNSHSSDVLSVDLEQNIFVSGSRDAIFKVWSISFDNDSENVVPLHSQQVSERIWSVAVCEGCKLLAVGCSSLMNNSPLNIFDLCSYKNTLKLGETYKRSGILDIKWENSQTLWTCGYDMHLRRWDLRTGQCEQSWEDTFNSTLYCLDIDKAYTAFTGCQRHGRVVLWDTRKTNYVQMYFMDACRNRGRSSPVYSLSFDSTQLFVATDQHLSRLDFRVTKGNIKNYKDIFYKQIVI